MNAPHTQNAGKSGGPLDQKVTEQFARSFNMVYSNALIYQSTHPLTKRSVEDFGTILGQVLAKVEMVTLMLERDALYVEEWRVDTKMNASRVVGGFKKVGIQSIAFERGVTIDEIQTMVTMLREAGSFQNLDAMKEYLQRQNVRRIRLNYVLYKKITTDEKVVDKDAAVGGAGPAASGTSAVNEKVLEGMAGLFSLAGLIGSPQTIAQNLVTATDGQAPDSQRAMVLGALRNLSDRVGAKSGDGFSPTPDQLMEAILRLKSDLQEGLDVQKQMGRIINDDGVLVGEMDKLTYQVIVRMAQDEYRTGQISVKRLAQIIRRMLPDVSELKRLLPMLKAGLISEGMSLGDFLFLVRELNLELKSDGLAQALEQGAEHVGLSVDEIIQGIKSNPQEAARLIVLATEIRKGTQGDDSQVSSLLTDYVERVSAEMALQSNQDTRPENSSSMEKMLTGLEQQLLTKMKAQGTSATVIKLVEAELSKRLPTAVRGLKTDWLFDVVAKGRDLSVGDLVHLLGTVVENEADLSDLREPFSATLQAQGHSPEKVAEVLDRVNARLKVRDGLATQPLPRGVLNVNNTVYFLQREIGLNLRYSNPFSTVMITVVRSKVDGTWNELTPEECSQVFPEIYTALTKLLRDLDIIGSIGALARNVPFVILSMTDPEGATVVRKRLEDRLGSMRYPLKGAQTEMRLAISTASFSRESATDLKTFLETIKTTHRRAEEHVLQALAAEDTRQIVRQ